MLLEAPPRPSKTWKPSLNQRAGSQLPELPSHVACTDDLAGCSALEGAPRRSGARTCVSCVLPQFACPSTPLPRRAAAPDEPAMPTGAAGEEEAETPKFHLRCNLLPPRDVYMVRRRWDACLRLSSSGCSRHRIAAW